MKVGCYTEMIIDMYCNKNLNTVQIAKEIGCSDSAVGKILEKNNIPRIHTPNEIIFSKEQIEDICYRYNNMETTIEISKIYNVCDITIAKLLRKNGVTIRSAKRRSKINRHNYFNNIDSIDKAYFLGWMISDGSIIESKTRQGREKVVSLEIHNKDRYILELFACVLGANASIVKVSKKRNHAYIRFASNQMSNDLAKYGVVPNKSFITYLPKLRNDLMPHLLRGIFDGDGTITIDKNNCGHIAFYGSEMLCNQISEYLNIELGFNKNKVSKTTCYHVWYGGRKLIKDMMRFLYNDCKEFYLERKYLKFKEVV